MMWLIGRGHIADNIRLEVYVFEVEAELLWDLSQHFFGQVSFGNRIVKTHELHNITSGWVAVIVTQNLPIAVQLLHQFELVAVADTHYDDRRRQERSLNNKLLDGAHIVNRAIRQNQKHKILVVLRLVRRDELVESFDNWCEEGRAGQLYVRQILLVCLKDATYAHYSRLLGTSIQREAVLNDLLAERFTTESKSRKHF